MAHERSTEITHRENPNQRQYDVAYYNELQPFITGNVLDIGAGAGMFTREYAKKGDVTKIVCVDKFTEQLQNYENKTEIVQALLEEPIEPLYRIFVNHGKFDTIVSTEFIEHIPQESLEPLLVSVSQMLTDDGYFVGSTPNKVSPTTNPYHLYEYTLSELKGILEKHFTRVQIRDNGQYCTVWKAQK